MIPKPRTKNLRARAILFPLAAVLVGVALVLLPLFCLDLYLHEKFNRNYIGYNIRGYRGDLLGPKPPGGFRVAFLGGSTALGYGVGPRQTLPYLLEGELRKIPGLERTEVANLGWNVQGVYSFPFTIRSYRDLKADVYIFYLGYTDLGINLANWRYDSLMFRLTGYMPIWPLIFREKAAVMLTKGKLNEWYLGKVFFQPNLGGAEKTVAQGLMGMADAADSMARILSAWAGNKRQDTPEQFKNPADPWAFYLAQVKISIETAIAQGGKVLLLGQPRISPEHAEQQAALFRFWKNNYPEDSRVEYLDSAAALDLKDPRLAPDGMHLSLEGHEILAPLIVPTLRRLRNGK